MSLLEDYDRRTSWKYGLLRGFFQTSDSLTEKVAPDGGFVPFPGSTVVFRPGKTCFCMIRMFQDFLYYRLGPSGMLARRLPDDTVHMTLHDLISPEAGVYAAAEEADAKIAESIRQAAGIAENAAMDFAGETIAMVPDRIVSMVSKSLVLLLRPQTERDFETLMEMYRRFDCIRRLPYPLTPHITLAYFRPGTLDGDRLQEATAPIQPDPGNAPPFIFYPEGLTAQYFSDMGTYADVPVRICFCGEPDLSVMAACILNSLAAKRGLRVTGEPGNECADTQGRVAENRVRRTLEAHGIGPGSVLLPSTTLSHHECKDFTDIDHPIGNHPAARYIEDKDVSRFTYFAAVSGEAMDRFSALCVPKDKVFIVSRFFYGVKDPAYGASMEEAFEDLMIRTRNCLDALEAHLGPRIRFF